MKNSIIQTTKECMVCRTTKDLHRHHIFPSKNRQKSEQFGCTCWLCGSHHNLSDLGVHFNKELDDELKDYCQRAFERKYSHIEFMYHFGRNYIQDKYNEGGYIWIS